MAGWFKWALPRRFSSIRPMNMSRDSCSGESAERCDRGRLILELSGLPTLELSGPRGVEQAGGIGLEERGDDGACRLFRVVPRLYLKRHHFPECAPGVGWRRPEAPFGIL